MDLPGDLSRATNITKEFLDEEHEFRINRLAFPIGIGGIFWFEGTLAVQFGRQFNWFSPANQVYVYAATPILSKVCMDRVMRLYTDVDTPHILYDLTVMTAIATLLDGVALTVPPLRRLFYGTEGAVKIFANMSSRTVSLLAPSTEN